ncbi:MAG: glycosyltransferase family 2 protein [Weeksellaceae bacterium]|nr:glycosyltransferase family 2 protein [Weeksellaceae bacterium]
MVDFSFIIVTYNSNDLIDACISSIFNFADIGEERFEVIIVDNSNADNHQRLTDLLAEKKFKDKISIIHNPMNGGYGHGNNIGIRAAIGEYICIMNPDVRLAEPLLVHTKGHFEINPELAVLGYKQTGGANLSYFIKPEYKPAIGVSILTKISNSLNLFSEHKFYLSGAFFFARKADMESVGLFDERIFLYFEEADISNRLLMLNKRIQFDTSKKYVHLNGGRDFSRSSFENEMKSLKYYIEKFHLDRKKIAARYLSEYQFNLLLFNFTGKKDRADKTRKEIEVIKEYFFQ